MNVRIHIRDLVAWCVIGVFPRERRRKQRVVLNIMLETDRRRAAKTDRLDDAVDYKALKKHILSEVRRSRFNLLESLADHVAKICVGVAGVRRATVVVDKPGALRFARSVAVEITRVRGRKDA